jgi:hypothetical protein
MPSKVTFKVEGCPRDRGGAEGVRRQGRGEARAGTAVSRRPDLLRAHLDRLVVDQNQTAV